MRNETFKMSNGSNVITLTTMHTEAGKYVAVVDNNTEYDFSSGIIHVVRAYRAIGYELIDE